MPIPNYAHLGKAIGMFSGGILGAPHSFSTAFESLGVRFHMQAVVEQHSAPPDEGSQSRQLARLFGYVSFRVTELMLRLEQLNWMQGEFTNRSGSAAAQWPNFAALAIKDFHVDLGSLMDAVAPAILQAVGAFDAKGERKLPGFADVQRSGSPRSQKFREQIPAPVVAVVDSTDDWWPTVKKVRDDLAHREHMKIVFGDAAQGVLFQIYTPQFSPLVSTRALLWPEGHNVADFRLYSAAVLAEVLVFLQDLGIILANHLPSHVPSAAGVSRDGDYTYILEPLRRLVDAAQT